jgi:hypothetical protein
VMTRVRSLMSDVSTFKCQRATADAPSSAGQPDGGALLSSGSASGRQLIGTSLSDYQDGVAARVLLQQWQARQHDIIGSEVPKAFTPTQASAVLGRLAVQTTISIVIARLLSVADDEASTGVRVVHSMLHGMCTQAARVQELLQQLTALSADAGQAADNSDGHLSIGLGAQSRLHSVQRIS